GRVEFGTGEGSSAAELDGFGVDPEDKRAMWEEGVRVALRCMSEAPFTGHAGRFVTLPPRNVVPKPVQKPHPPVWVAYTERDTLRRYEAFGVDQVILSSQSGNNRHEDVMESMELFGQTVLPEFLERDQSAEAAKAQRLEPIIEAALARKPSSDHPPLPEPDFA